MASRRSCQQLLMVLLAVFVVAGTGCGGTSPGAGAAGPKPGHWEGSQPSVSFDVTSEGTIRGFNLVGTIPLGRCTITLDEITMGEGGGFEVGQESESANRISARLTSATTMAGTYEIKVCKGPGDNYTVVLAPEEKAWSAEWKGPSATMPSEPSGAVPPTPTPTSTSAPTSIAAATPTALPREGIFVDGSVRVVPAEGLVLRESAGLSSAVVALLNPGTVLDVIGGPQESSDLVWWQLRIRDGGQEGWAAAGGGGSVYLEPVPAP